MSVTSALVLEEQEHFKLKVSGGKEQSQIVLRAAPTVGTEGALLLADHWRKTITGENHPSTGWRIQAYFK